MIDTIVYELDSELHAVRGRTQYKSAVDSAEKADRQLEELARTLSKMPSVTSFDSTKVQEALRAGMDGLVVGGKSDEQLGFFRSTRIAFRIKTQIMKSSRRQLRYTQFSSSVTMLSFRFFQKWKRGSFFSLIFHFDATGKNIASVMIGWVDPNGNPIKRNVTM